MENQGKFITFEGCDGSGKTSQAKALAEYLEEKGYDVILTREPGGSDGGYAIRQLLLDGEVDRWSVETEILLFTAARRDHVEKIIRPALDDGKIVICDRFHDSTLAYQGARKPDIIEMIKHLHESMIGLEPDVTFFLNMNPEDSYARCKAREGQDERFQKMGLIFQQKIHANFIAMCSTNRRRFRRIDASGSYDDVFENIRERIDSFLIASFETSESSNIQQNKEYLY